MKCPPRFSQMPETAMAKIQITTLRRYFFGAMSMTVKTMILMTTMKRTTATTSLCFLL
jgi:hypothetical protein